jgi:hypothetical protein
MPAVLVLLIAIPCGCDRKPGRAIAWESPKKPAPPPAAVSDVPAAIEVEPELLDVGRHLVYEKTSGTLRLTNRGDEPLKIVSCHPSCGCTSLNCPEGQTLAAGEAVEVEISLDTGYRAQEMRKKITFVIEDRAPLIVPIHARVVGYVSIEPESIDPGTVATVTLRANDGRPFRIVGMDPLIAELPGEASLEHELSVSWDAWRDAGHRARLTFDLDHPKAYEIRARVRAKPAPPASEPQDS